MSNRLAIFLGDFSNLDSHLESILECWTDAQIIHDLAWVDTSQADPKGAIPTTFSSNGNLVQIHLFDLVTSRIWERVTVVATRVSPLVDYPDRHWQSELAVLGLLNQSFADNSVTLFRSATVSVADLSGIRDEAFAPEWSVHLLQEPIVRIDPAVAAQPMREEHRAQLVALLSLTVAGAFVWQSGPLLDSISDPVLGDHKPVRIARSFLRVVNAGRLTDEILGGAFPASGPWSVPGDLVNARAVPPAVQVPDQIVLQLEKIGGFGFTESSKPYKPRATSLGFRAGLTLFFKEFRDALIGIPQSMIATVRGEIEGWVQSLTFGEESSVLLKFDPLSAEIDIEDLAAQFQVASITDDVDVLTSSRPWELLQKVSFGLVDGGKFPDNFEPAKSGIHRLVFTDPVTIGPEPSYPQFEVSEDEGLALEIDRQDLLVQPLDVVLATALLDKVRARLTEGESLEKLGDQTESGSATVPVVEGSAVPIAPNNPKKVSEKAKSKKKFDSRFRRRKKKVPSAKAVPPPFVAKEDSPPNSTTDGSETKQESQVEQTAEGQTSVPQTGAASEASATTERYLPGHPEFKPNEFEYVTKFYKGQNPDALRRYQPTIQPYEQATAAQILPMGNWTKEQTCDFCGTSFDHGVLIRHRPSGTLIHLGRNCAEKKYGVGAVSDYERQLLEGFKKRLEEWMLGQSASLLWRVDARIQKGRERANRNIATAIEILESRPAAQQAETKAVKKFRRWTKRGVFGFLLFAIAAIVLSVFAIITLLILALSLAGYAFTLGVSLLVLARGLVRARFKLEAIEDRYERAFREGRHSVAELVRLSSVHEQFMDWQAIIREIVHVPFGRQASVALSSRTISEIERPAGFVIASSTPDKNQKMKPYLKARSQTMHTGWLSGIRDTIVAEWAEVYRNSRVVSDADNILPESDNASSKSVAARHPFADENVYYPRSDLRRRLLRGELQQGLVKEKSQQIADDLRHTPIESLLGEVSVQGGGSALSGLPVRDFLASLSQRPDEHIAFLPDVISDSHPELREIEPEVILPPYESAQNRVASVQVEPGLEFTAAAWIVELSPLISPLAALRGMVAEHPSSIGFELPSSDEPSVS